MVNNFYMKILFLGGNRYFGKEIVSLLSKNKKNQIFLINRGNNKNLNKKNIFHLKVDRGEINKIKFFIEKNYFDIVFDNIAYKLNDVKKLLKIVGNNYNTYFFTSTIMVKILNDKNSKVLLRNYTKNELNYGKNKLKIEKFLKDKKIKNYRIIRPHSVFGSNDFSGKSKDIIHTSKQDIVKFKIKDSDKLQFIYEEDLIKIIYKLITNYKSLKFKVLEIANNHILFKNFKKLSIQSNKTIMRKKYPFPINLTIPPNKKIKNIISFNFSKVNFVVKKVSKKFIN